MTEQMLFDSQQRPEVFFFARALWSLSDINLTELEVEHSFSFVHSCTVHLDTIKVFYLPIDAQ